MASEQLRPDAKEYAWVRSVVDTVEFLIRESNRLERLPDGRAVRWNETVVVADDPAEVHGPAGVGRSFSTPTDALVLRREDLGQITAALRGQGEPAGVMAATEDVGSQAIRLAGARAQRPDMLAKADTDFDTGLGRAWAQSNSSELWQLSDSSVLGLRMPDPDPYVGRDDDLAQAVRDLIDEVRQQQELGPTTAVHYGIHADSLLQRPPDSRFQEIVRRLPGSSSLTTFDLRELAQWDFRSAFNRAVRDGNPGAGTRDSAVAASVRGLAGKVTAKANARAKAQAEAGTEASTGATVGSAEVDPKLAELMTDGASPPAQGAIGKQGDQTAAPVAGEQPAAARPPGKTGPHTQGLGG
ncbi:hypothetical protein EV646_101614 [Kribbella antiqua]|uniref:Uncharacterized protein n=1 Tax=Kribbella antiqua TaxID=2512217 RepID=A0A4R2J074_9ACTN|nr:hypothetical protein [Kribbella antiqua]TCO51621.1 hypothetical protein EV646_101614 [Kribbella antiqua]